MNTIMKKMKAIFVLVLLAGMYTFAGAQSMNNMSNMQMSKKTGMVEKAVCVVYPTQGNHVTGTIIFTKVKNGIRVEGDLHGLAEGKHGIHIHEYGDCSSPDGMSAGGHFNPMNKTHAGPMEAMRHEGDMGNIVADSKGNAHIDYVDNALSFKGMTSIIGRSVVIHQSADDFKTQPTGNSGARVACGVIGIGK
ncbi:MAG: superoxide dismutase family protein [Paludibacter sp.]